MERFTILRAKAAPLMISNINTDAIYPMNSSWSGSSYGGRLFGNWRYDAGGGENSDFILNRPRYRDARIVVSGANFGCGSSREMAVWALMDFGIRCVIAPSFGDIFAQNAFQNGLLVIPLAIEATQRIADAVTLEDATLTINLYDQRIEAPDGSVYTFEIPPERREALLEGLRQIDVLRKFIADIDDFEEEQRKVMPWVYGGQDSAQSMPTSGSSSISQP